MVFQGYVASLSAMQLRGLQLVFLCYPRMLTQNTPRELQHLKSYLGRYVYIVSKFGPRKCSLFSLWGFRRLYRSMLHTWTNRTVIVQLYCCSSTLKLSGELLSCLISLETCLPVVGMLEIACGSGLLNQTDVQTVQNCRAGSLVSKANTRTADCCWNGNASEKAIIKS